MHIALVDLKLDKLKIIYPGDVNFPLSKNIEAVGLKTVLREEKH